MVLRWILVTCFAVDIVSGFQLCCPIALSCLFFLMGNLVRFRNCTYTLTFSHSSVYKFSIFSSLADILFLHIYESYISAIILLVFVATCLFYFMVLEIHL